MIDIFGDDGSSEYDAAKTLRQWIVSEWGEIPELRQRVSIVVSAKCPGQKVQDVDLLLLVQLKQPLSIKIPRAVQRNLPAEVIVQSLCTVIEVKDHSPGGVDFTADGKVRVRYQSHWHDCTLQNEQQVYAVKGFLEHMPGSAAAPFISRVIWLRGVPHAELPATCHAVVGMDASWPEMVAAIMSKQWPHFRDGFHILNAAKETGDIIRIHNTFTRRLQPTVLDRRKLEALAQPAPDLLALPSGERQVILRGRGGTGKTIALLQLAYQRYTEARQRSLFLTYNVALAAEVERLLLLRGVRDRAGEAAIRVVTLHGFFRQLLLKSGLLSESDDFTKVFPERRRALLDYLADEDLLAAVRSESDLLNWDLVCIDEAQDCPPEEREILHRLFGPDRCAIADGIDQMVRPTEACDWMPTTAIRKTTATRILKKSLRQQYNLCRFANAAAEQLGLPQWNLEPNTELPGGRVVLLTGPPRIPQLLWNSISAENLRLGNQPIDMLFCVGASAFDGDGNCHPIADFQIRQLKVWDGTQNDIKRMPPLDHMLHRFVRYESCRGLEGWVTVLYGLDSFYESRLRRFREMAPPGASDTAAAAWAAEWTMIPLTRCISTLIIQLDNPDNALSRIFYQLSSVFRDFVEVSNG